MKYKLMTQNLITGVLVGLGAWVISTFNFESYYIAKWIIVGALSLISLASLILFILILTGKMWETPHNNDNKSLD
jgi:uncharacterized membrane protein